MSKIKFDSPADIHAELERLYNGLHDETIPGKVIDRSNHLITSVLRNAALAHQMAIEKPKGSIPLIEDGKGPLRGKAD